MARVQGVLTALNDLLLYPNVTDEFNGGGSVQYGIGGLGTIVVEVHSGYLDANGNPEWTAIAMSDSGNNIVASLAAPGIAFFDAIGINALRIRKSVAGAGPVRVALNYKRG